LRAQAAGSGVLRFVAAKFVLAAVYIDNALFAVWAVATYVDHMFVVAFVFPDFTAARAVAAVALLVMALMVVRFLGGDDEKNLLYIYGAKRACGDFCSALLDKRTGQSKQDEFVKAIASFVDISQK